MGLVAVAKGKKSNSAEAFVKSTKEKELVRETAFNQMGHD